MTNPFRGTNNARQPMTNAFRAPNRVRQPMTNAFRAPNRVRQAMTNAFRGPNWVRQPMTNAFRAPNWVRQPMTNAFRAPNWVRQRNYRTGCWHNLGSQRLAGVVRRNDIGSQRVAGAVRGERVEPAGLTDSVCGDRFSTKRRCGSGSAARAGRFANDRPWFVATDSLSALRFRANWEGGSAEIVMNAPWLFGRRREGTRSGPGAVDLYARPGKRIYLTLFPTRAYTRPHDRTYLLIENIPRKHPSSAGVHTRRACIRTPHGPPGTDLQGSVHGMPGRAQPGGGPRARPIARSRAQ